jgi:hypothetical protein
MLMNNLGAGNKNDINQSSGFWTTGSYTGTSQATLNILLGVVSSCTGITMEPTSLTGTLRVFGTP